jgi:hypothetical protein
MFESKWKEVRREWRKVRDKEIYNLFYTPDTTGRFSK